MRNVIEKKGDKSHGLHTPEQAARQVGNALFDDASGERLASLRATDVVRGDRDGGSGNYGTPPARRRGSARREAERQHHLLYATLGGLVVPSCQQGLYADPR
jgi:hypothetical protein